MTAATSHNDHAEGVVSTDTLTSAQLDALMAEVAQALALVRSIPVPAGGLE